MCPELEEHEQVGEDYGETKTRDDGSTAPVCWASDRWASDIIGEVRGELEVIIDRLVRGNNHEALESARVALGQLHRLLSEPTITTLAHLNVSNAQISGGTPSAEADCSACFWNEGGRCYVEPCDRRPDGRSTKLAEASCEHYVTKRAMMSRVIPSEMLVITSEQNIEEMP